MPSIRGQLAGSRLSVTMYCRCIQEIASSKHTCFQNVEVVKKHGIENDEFADQSIFKQK